MNIQAGKPVTGSDFIGRDKEIQTLIEYMKMGQNVVIVGPRRFGKTSLVLKVLGMMEQTGNYTVYIDFFTNPDIGLLSSAITESVLKNHQLHRQFRNAKNSISELFRNIKLKAVVEDFQFILGFAERGKNPWELIGESIDFVDSFAARHKRRMICAYDEFGDIRKFDPKGKLVKLFRSKIQHHENTSYIFSGSYESVMNQMFMSRQSPFYRSARIIRLGYLERTTLVVYVKKKFSDLGYELPGSFAENLVSFTKGHPYYTQLGIQQMALYNALYGELPGLDTLKNVLMDVEKDYLEKVWEDI